MIELDVEGMTCMGCVASVEKALKSADPAAEIKVDLETGHVVVEGALTLPAAREAIEACGFDVVG